MMANKTADSPRKAIHRWTIDRVATDLAIILVAVPSALELLAPTPRGYCAMTDEFYACSLGLAILGVRAGGIALKALNDAGERWLRLPNSPIARPKPQPLDDLGSP